ncbi:DUF262 domain-containing protein [Elusimicrobiota bacterium]
MAKISNERTGEFLKEALLVLKDKGGEFPSGELIKEMGKRLTLNSYEKSINNSGQYRWITNFRFYSIGLVKAGWVKKSGRTWKLADTAKNIESLSPIEVFNFVVESYDKWNAERAGTNIADESIIEENEEPELLMQVKPDDIDFRSLIDGVSACKIQIPPFQRSFIWKSSDIRYLLDSIYRGYPVGSFIFWKTTRKLPRTRTIGSIVLEYKDVIAGTEISYVLDGQQRITSLFAAVKGSTIDEECFRFLFDLKSKTFIVSRVENLEELDKKDKDNLQISIEKIFTESRATYRQIIREYPVEYEGILDTLYDRFVSYRFSLIQVIDQEPKGDEERSEGVRQVVRMFSRINETGRKLTIVAKMVARCWGEGFDLREELDEFYNREKELETIREEIILQAASVILNYRKSRSPYILETSIRKLEAEWDVIIDCFLLAVEFVKTKLRIKILKYLPFDVILVPLTYLFYKKRDLDSEQTKLVEKWFWRACLSNRYDSTVEARSEEDCIAFDDLLAGKSPEFNFLIDWKTLKNRLISQRYNLRNAFVKTILSLYSFAEPKNLLDGRNVHFENVFSGYYKHNLHHIFPQAYLRVNEAEKKEIFDSIVNIMFIPKITNTDILDKAPSKYFSEFQKGNSSFQEIIKCHYIPDLNQSGIPDDNYLKFLDYRANQIVQAFRIRTGMTSQSEEYFEDNPTKPIDILETQIRGFIHDLLKKQTEDFYWGQYIPIDVQRNVDSMIKEDIKRHPYKSEEYERDEAKIDFLDVMDYSKVVLSNWEVFGIYFGSKGETEKHFLALKHYRNAVKHGRNLNEIDKKNGEAAVLWLENILEKPIDD